jgi:nucleotide-binding universal stress UspA family protein
VASDATLHIVSAYKPMSSAAISVGAGDHWQLHPRSMADEILEEVASTARGQGVKAEVHAKRGDPANAVISVVKAVHADAVVVGNKGMRGAKRFVLGSVPNAVAHGAPCTVIIVKTT